MKSDTAGIVQTLPKQVAGETQFAVVVHAVAGTLLLAIVAPPPPLRHTSGWKRCAPKEALVTAENIKALATALSLEERADLAAFLISTTDASEIHRWGELTDAELDRRWGELTDAELDRRRAELERGEVNGSTWDEVRARGRRES